MANVTIDQLEKVAKSYNDVLVPSLFEPWTQHVIKAANIKSGRDVLDVACGTGVLTRAIAKKVYPGGSVSGVDLNPGMLKIAERISPDICWKNAPAESLPWNDGEFDAVVCQFGLMFFEDRNEGVKEMMRVLKKGGTLAVAVFCPLDTMPTFRRMCDIYEKFIDKEVGDTLRFPFLLGDENELKRLFTSAGIKNPIITKLEGIAHFSSVREMILADVNGWFPFAGIELEQPKIETVIEEAESELSSFVLKDGSVKFPVHVIMVVAEK